MAIFKYNNKTVNQAYWGENNFPKAIYDGNAYRLRYVEHNDTKYLAHLTLNDGSVVDIEDDGTGVLKQSMTSGYKSTCVSADITTVCTSIGNDAFSQCTGLTSVIIPDSVTSIGDDAFTFCRGLTSVIIPDSVTSIGANAFTFCRGLTSVIIPDSVTSIGLNAFEYCSSLTSVTIGSGVASIPLHAFRGCTSLTSVTIPNTVLSIGDIAFSACTALTEITCDATTPPTLGTGVFDNTNDCPIYVPCESVNAYKTAWGAYAHRIQCKETPVYGGKARLTLNDGSIVEIPGTGELTRNETSGYSATTVNVEIGSGCTSIGYMAINFYKNITSIVVPDSVTSIGDRAFANCRSLTSITIPDSVTSIGMTAFYNCSGLTSVNIPSGVTSIEPDVFSRCIGLTSIIIPDSVTSIGTGAFDYCSGLTSVNIPSGVTSIGVAAFSHCKSLTSITCNSITPPTLSLNAFDDTNDCPIYVPAESVEAYKSATNWSTYAGRIQPIT